MNKKLKKKLRQKLIRQIYPDTPVWLRWMEYSFRFDRQVYYYNQGLHWM